MTPSLPSAQQSAASWKETPIKLRTRRIVFGVEEKPISLEFLRVVERNHGHVQMSVFCLGRSMLILPEAIKILPWQSDFNRKSRGRLGPRDRSPKQMAHGLKSTFPERADPLFSASLL